MVVDQGYWRVSAKETNVLTGPRAMAGARWRTSLWALLFWSSGLMMTAASSMLQVVTRPERTTNERKAVFVYTCTHIDVSQEECMVEMSLDSGPWELASEPNGTVTIDGLSDGQHSLSLRLETGHDDMQEDPLVFTWTVDTEPPDTIIDTGPNREGEAPRPEEADPYLFFTFHASEESCDFRYQYDDQIELIAVWPADDESEIDGQVSVTQFSVDETEGSAELEISVYLTGITSDSMNSTDAIPAAIAIRYPSGGGLDSSSDEERPPVVLTLGSPEVDRVTSETVFSLSAESEFSSQSGRSDARDGRIFLGMTTRDYKVSRTFGGNTRRRGPLILLPGVRQG